MEEKLIYEKKYPRRDGMTDPLFQKAITEAKAEPNKRSSEEIYQAIYGDIQYISIPKRMDEAYDFINLAIDVSKLYELNVRIIRDDCSVRVDLSVDFSDSMSYINTLFGMADNISFEHDRDGRDICVILVFYTHVVVKHGVSMSP